MPILLILVPLVTIIILNLPFKDMMKKAAYWIVMLLFIAQIFIVLFNLQSIDLEKITSFLKFSLTVDSLSRVLLFCIGIVLLTTLFVGKSTLKGEDKVFNFINLLLLVLIGMNGVVMVTDLFSLFVFAEITAVASFILVALNNKQDGFEAAFKYIMLSSIATVMMLSSIAFLVLFAGSTGFSDINAALKVSSHNLLIISAMGIFLCGLFIKGGLMPFHAWLPDVHSSAPAPVSVLLSGVQIKVLGAYTAIRLVTSVFTYNPSIMQVLMIVGTLSIVAGALAALGQSDFKRMLAYSSISQVGYIMIGLGSGSALGIFGAIFHLFNHAIFKSLLFVNAAAVEHQTGTRDMDKMSGLATRMPITGITSTLASLSAAGVPPLAGFWSKLIIIVGLWMSGNYVYAVIAVLGSILTLSYLLSMQRRVFFGKIKEEFANIKEAEFGLVFPSVVLALIIVAVGLAFPFFSSLLKF